MKTSTLTILDQYRNEVEKVTYDTDTLLIQTIEVWSESFQGFRHISPAQFKNDSPFFWDKLEVRVAEHRYEQLVGDIDRKEAQVS